MRALILTALVALPVAGQTDETSPDEEITTVFDEVEVPESMTADQARPALERSVAWLLSNQREDGGWATSVIESTWEAGFSVETYYAWQVCSSALACMALMAVEETPERRASLEAGLEWLCTTRMPKRGNHWDVDYVWTVLYGLAATVIAADDPRFQSEEWQTALNERGRLFYDLLVENQAPSGGWAYYDDPVFSNRPKWATSFCTALVLPYVDRAIERGWGDDRALLERAIRYVQRCSMPEGAYAYDLTPVPRINGGEHINRLKGSLGRIQVCNWGLAKTGDPRITDDLVSEGLENFFEHHRFLDVAYMRPIPHEAYYANAGYFYLFGHYYAAEAIELLPEDQREHWHAKLRPHLVKVQQESGLSVDFLGTGYLDVAGTAYTALALQLGMPD